MKLEDKSQVYESIGTFTWPSLNIDQSQVNPIPTNPLCNDYKLCQVKGLVDLNNVADLGNDQF
jgi:hypothetical protein